MTERIPTMCHKTAKVTSHDAMPCRALPLVELVWFIMLDCWKDFSNGLEQTGRGMLLVGPYPYRLLDMLCDILFNRGVSWVPTIAPDRRIDSIPGLVPGAEPLDVPSQL